MNDRDRQRLRAGATRLRDEQRRLIVEGFVESVSGAVGAASAVLLLAVEKDRTPPFLAMAFVLFAMAVWLPGRYFWRARRARQEAEALEAQLRAGAPEPDPPPAVSPERAAELAAKTVRAAAQATRVDPAALTPKPEGTQ
ncbi:MAG: hypothetical protein U0324_29295 [Polyangiales bacterium]